MKLTKIERQLLNAMVKYNVIENDFNDVETIGDQYCRYIHKTDGMFRFNINKEIEKIIITLQ